MPETLNLTDALEIFSDCHQEIRKACLDNMSDIDSQYQPYKKLEDDDEFTIEAINQHVNYLHVKGRTENYVRTIKRIDSLKRPARSGGITANDIARAKEVPIGDIYTGRLFGSKDKVGLCSLHQERTPSFHIYTEKNSWHCYGCEQGGDSIDLVMKQDSVDFITAVKKLSRK